MDGVQQIIDYAYDQGLYVIINVRHENWWDWNNPQNSTMQRKNYGSKLRSVLRIMTKGLFLKLERTQHRGLGQS